MSLFTLATLATAALAQNTSTSLEVVSSYTTYLESATTLVENGVTYTATGPTTLVVSDCPCTRTHTFTTEYETVCSATGPSEVSSTGLVASNGAGAAGPWYALLPLLLL